MSKIIQDIVLLMDPPKFAWDISQKCANMVLNRFCIDEEIAFESSGVYYLNNSKSDISLIDPYKNAFDRKLIASACKNVAKNTSKDREIHFVYAGYADYNYHDYYYNEVKTFIFEGIKKYNLKPVRFTHFYMERNQLITKEMNDIYCLGTYNFSKKRNRKDRYRKDTYRNVTINDDVESLLEDLCLHQRTDNVLADTFFLPKLSEEEKELIEKGDPNCLATFKDSNPDINADVMKLSKSDSKFVEGRCSRRTCMIKN